MMPIKLSQAGAERTKHKGCPGHTELTSSTLSRTGPQVAQAEREEKLM
jgi:hypothetical protein